MAAFCNQSEFEKKRRKKTRKEVAVGGKKKQFRSQVIFREGTKKRG